MLEKLEGKVIAFLIALGVIACICLLVWLWGHHVGSAHQAAADAKKLTTCSTQNVALAQAIKTDAATIEGLKEANATMAATASANEAGLKQSVAKLTAKLAQSKTAYAKRQKSLRGVVKNDKASSQWAVTPVPPAILDILRQ